MIIDPNIGIEAAMVNLAARFAHDSFGYDDPSVSFRKVVTQHFRGRKGDRHGVYVIRQTDGRIIYIGKAGTVTRDGQFKRQDIPGRLKAPKYKDMDTDDWFAYLVRTGGPVSVSYYLLPVQCSPAYVEAGLLQSYLNEHGCLPEQNSAL